MDTDPYPERRADQQHLSGHGPASGSDLPSGTTTLLFTDIEGSTQLLQRLGDRYAITLQQHHHLLTTAFARWNGRVVDTQGDSFFVAFVRAGDAVAAAIEAQRALLHHTWLEGNQVRVRMGIHTGEPRQVGERYVGLDVHRAARIGAAGYGGQVLLSQTTGELIERDLPEDVRLKDLGAHQLKDMPRAEHLFQIVTADLQTDFPPLKSVLATPYKLPVLLTSFIGREQQIAELKRLLASPSLTHSPTRLLTLTGAGGSGKTRLAIQLANDLLPSLQDGAWFVDLSPLSNPALITQAVASVLSVHEQPGRSLQETLLDYLRGKALLLLLDNCEQFVTDCAELVQTLLYECPRLQILATSRERLNLDGEMVWLVPVLSLPAVDGPDWIESSRSEAVHLFVERATSALPGFTLTTQNASAIADICRRLDGIPLAIELAAVRVKFMAPKQIAERLGDTFRLLTRGSQTAPIRQQTLRAALDWSYELLSAQEQRLFRQLSVFAGGFTLESAERVCPDGDDAAPLREDDILDLLSNLVDKSLVTVIVRNDEEQTRYRLLEPIRQYASGKLFAEEEADRCRGRHMEYFARVANEATTSTPAQENTLFNRFEQEHDNLRAALDWALGQNASEPALALCASLGAFWETRGYWTESGVWFGRALTNSREREMPQHDSVKQRTLFANVLSRDGHRALEQGDYPLADARLQESLLIFQELDNRSGIADVLFSLGCLAWYQGDSEVAQSFLEEYLAIGRELDDQIRIPHALWLLGIFARQRGDLANALALSQESLERYRVLGDKTMQGWVLENLGVVAILDGDFERAHTLFDESMAFHRTVASAFGAAALTMNKGFLSWYERDYVGARGLFKDTLLQFQLLGISGYMNSLCLVGVAAIEIAQRQPERATLVMGALHAEIVRTGMRFTDIYLDAYDKSIAAAHDQLEDSTFAKAWADGHAVSIQQAVKLALAQG